ncbi:MAG TPA: hypothetical protein PKH07_18150, partial [bacterium]|nr:hypothetical protein [bacterium]
VSYRDSARRRRQAFHLLGASVSERDGRVTKDDDVEYFIDPDRSQYYFYKFFTNSLGTLFDSKRALKSWDSSAEVKTVTDELGWTAVMRIPFADFERSVPRDGSEWGFNFGTQTGRTNFWVPIHGHETPEKLGTIVFGGENLRPAQLMKVPRIGIGENTLETQCDRGIRYSIEAMDGNKRCLFRRRGRVAEDGSIRFTLKSDQIDHVNIVLSDVHGNKHLSFWSLFHSPAVTNRLPALLSKAKEVRRRLALFPEDAKIQAERLVRQIQNSQSWIPTDLTQKEWTRFSETVQQFERQIGEAFVYAKTLQRVPGAQFGVGLESPMRKVMIRDLPFEGYVADSYRVKLAGNEHEGVQVVVIPFHRDIENASVRISDVKHAVTGAAFNGKVTASLVGHVMTEEPGLYNPGYTGWYPDPILDFQQSASVAKGEHVSFWIDVATQK